MTRTAQRRSALARCSRMAKMVRTSNIEKKRLFVSALSMSASCHQQTSVRGVEDAMPSALEMSRSVAVSLRVPHKPLGSTAETAMPAAMMLSNNLVHLRCEVIFISHGRFQ